MQLKSTFKVLCAASILSANLVHAMGVKPETSVVIVNEADGEGTMNVTNTDKAPVLLYTKLENIPEDKDPLLVVATPIARLEGGETQQVRFILNEHGPLKTERMKRVAFEGIPTANKAGGTSKVAMVIRQDLPVLINPAGLARNEQPWKLLKWSVENGHLEVHNDSPYVVRLSQAVQVLPQKINATLSTPYVLPGEHLQLKAAGSIDGARQIRLFPATVYGYSVPSYDAPLTGAAAASTTTQ